MKICRTATVPFFLYHHLQEQIRSTVRAGHDVTLVCAAGPELEALKQIPGVRIEVIDIPRAISPWRDLVALCRLFFFFRRHRFDLVHSTTPKAGLLSMLAARMAGVPIRLHTFTGQAWAELQGRVRKIAQWADGVTARMSTMTYTDSHSQRVFLLQENVLPAHRVRTLGAGSLAGVDTQRFSPQREPHLRQQTRAELGLRPEEKVICFVGRVTKDKGIVELVEAVEALRSEGRNCVLLLIGPFEPERDPLPQATLDCIEQSPCIRTLGYFAHPEKYMAVSEFLCLASYREGFGNVVLEAAAMGIPTVGTDIVGLRDAIVADETGLLVPPKDAAALAAALGRLLNDSALCQRMGEMARTRVLRDFDAVKVNTQVLAEYEQHSRHRR